MGAFQFTKVNGSLIRRGGTHGDHRPEKLALPKGTHDELADTSFVLLAGA